MPQNCQSQRGWVAGASDIETAVSWIVDHEDDPDIDEMPLVCSLDDSC